MRQNTLKNHIQHNWKFQILGILIAFVISLLAITISSAPTKKEKVSIFLTCFTSSQAFDDYVDSIKPEYLEIIELNVKHKEDTYYGTVIKGARKDADIIIVPESKVEYILFNDCLLLDNQIVSEFTDKSFDYYAIDNVNYGLKIYSKETHKGILEDLIIYNKDDSDEDCYLFINKNSLHLGKYNDSKYDGLVKILKDLLNYEAKSS